MSRYFYGGFLVIAVIGWVALLNYRTLGTSESSIQPMEMAEFGGVSLRIEYATTTRAKAHGLAGRESIPDDYGMLFVFPKDDRYGFWMKDTLVPLDIFWLDDKGQVVFMAQDVATSSYPHVFYPDTPARYVLETAAGFAAAHDIRIGTPLLLKNLSSESQ